MKGNQYEFWNQALSILKVRMPNNIFNSLALDAKIENFENDKLVIVMPFPFMLRRITHADKTALENALSEVIGRPIIVEFAVAPESERMKIKKIASAAQDIIERRKNLLKGDVSSDSKYENKGESGFQHSASQDDDTCIPLNPLYTFSTFVVGDNNRLAHAAGLAVSNNPGKEYNPLFIHSSVGLGKTHLLHAIGQNALSINPKLKVRLTTAEIFTNELIDAITSPDKMKLFRKKYRKCDYLLIDDIHFLIGKDATQEAFFHTLNTLFELNKQVVITSDRHPRELRALKERLINRFQLGLVVDIQKPTFETRLAILKKRAETSNIDVSPDVLELFAREMEGSIRSLIGCLNYVKHFQISYDRRVTLEDAKEIVEKCREDISRKDRPITIHHILDLLCHHYKVSLEELLGPSKSSRMSHPRQIGMYLARKHTNLTFQEIASAFHRDDHGTVHHAVKKISSLVEKDSVLARELNYIEEMLLGKAPRE